MTNKYSETSPLAILEQNGVPSDLPKLVPGSNAAPKATAKRKPAPPLDTDRAGTDYVEYKLTDIANAKRLVERHSSQIRYVHASEKWHIWDNARWRADTNDTLSRLAADTCEAIWQSEVGKTKDYQDKIKLLRHAKISATEQRIRAMISLAQSDLRVIMRQQDMDADPWLLGLPNGTLDLRTGAFRPARQEDKISKIAGPKYDAPATCPLWLSVLDRIFAGDENLIGFLQRAVGYSLTGRTSEQVLFFLHGQGANGKSLILGVIKALMGEYGTNADFESFLIHRSDGPRTDLARLQGARFVSAIETGEGRNLAEGIVKQLTGEDTLTARFLYKPEFEYIPSFKLWFSSNHKPVIKGTEQAMWRRIHLVPFSVSIPENERDPKLRDKLLLELPGILNWAVAGSLAWQTQGLQTPAEVRKATEDYRTESDILGAFFSDCCEMGAMYSVPATLLFATFKEWAATTGEHPMSQTAFGRRLSERGIETEKRGPKGVRHRVGVRLNDGRS